MPSQPALITGLYRCDNCDRDVWRVRKLFRWYVCDDCWAEVTPNFPQTEPGYWITETKWSPGAWRAETREQRKEIERFYDWNAAMEDKFIEKVVASPNRTRQYRKWRTGHLQPIEAKEPDRYYPYCACGQPRKVLSFGSPGVFGGPFSKYCPVCEARQEVETVFKMAPKMCGDRDEEEILDLLQRANPRAFELGVLPDYWFELKLKETESQ